MTHADWESTINNNNDTLNTLKRKVAECFIFATQKMGKNPRAEILPEFYYVPVSELMEGKPVMFKPFIAGQKNGKILVCQDLLKDTVKELKRHSDAFIDAFIQGMVLHEVLHHVFRHKSDTKEQMQIAEKEVHSWMKENAPTLEKIFNLVMDDIVEFIQLWYIKRS